MLQLTKSSEPIPGYMVKERLGVGGYGEVWSVQAPGGLAKAIKFIYGYFDDERATRELKALNRIKGVRHPFLLSLERIEIVDGQLLIVTELAEMSLKDRFEQVKQTGAPGIPREELLGYLRDAADALDYLSSHFSLQHLDIKPENLLLVGGHVKVADFGLVKDLHDVSASMMGGLTPIYAPPEVFDGRASLYSDQYSLAIVYQEMLTGVLPFPGRTPAQLAAQHLHVSPRLTPLPAADQPVIARALAKSADARFKSCRELVDALITGKISGAARADQPGVATVDSTSDTKSFKSQSGTSDTDWKPAGEKSAESRSQKTQIIGGDSEGSWQKPSVEEEAVVDAAAEVVNLPPLDVESTTSGLRPTLFIGVGGTGEHVLRQVRRRMRDRLGAPSAAPAVKMLLLDTDGKGLYSATQGDTDTALADAETVSLPLRQASDYTADSRNILQWLSRRWLYNIPRSLQTEGRRPLGRLAWVDHAQSVAERIRRTLTDIVSNEAIEATEKTAGNKLRSRTPQVFLIASISGGTGGGMVLDLAYTVRKILGELGMSDEGVCGILTHSTDRNPSSADLAVANAYACLSELGHYSGPHAFPGDPACGLPPFAADQGPFKSTYFVHLGDNLNDREFEASVSRLASYLFLSTASGAAGAFDLCRQQKESEFIGQPESIVRTFGLTSIGASQSRLANLVTELACKELVDQWRGAAAAAPAEPASGSLIEMAAQHSKAPALVKQVDVEGLAETHFAELDLNVAKLRKQTQGLVQKELSGNADAVYSKLRASALDASSEGPVATEDIGKLLTTIHSLFGALAVDDDARKATPNVPFRLALERDLKQLATLWGNGLNEWILSLTEQPQVRVGGASRAKTFCVNYLKRLESECNDLCTETVRAARALEAALTQLQQPVQPRGIFGRRVARPLVEPGDLLLELVRLRCDEAVFCGVCRMLVLLAAQAAAAGDEIKDLQHALSQLSERFTTASPWKETEAEALLPPVQRDVRTIVAGYLRVRMADLTQAVDRRFQGDFLAGHGGLRGVCARADFLQGNVPGALRTTARAEIQALLATVPIAQALLPEGEAEDQPLRLQLCLEGARPKITECGGGQRLLAILPDGASGSQLANTLTAFDPPATLLGDHDADIVFCYEAQDMRLVHVAEALIGERVDFIELATRLHTRTDVQWSKLARPRSRDTATRG